MAFIIVPNTAEVVLQGEVNGHAALMTLGFHQADPFTLGDLEGLLTAVEDWWDTYLYPRVSDSYNLPSIKATSLESDSAPTVTDSSFAHHTGAQLFEPVQDAVAMVVSFATDSRGRSYRGRNYVPALPAVALVNSSTWGAATVTAMTEAYEGLETVMSSTPYTHVVISRFHDGVARLFGEVTPVTHYTAKAKIGIQRRRVLGTGS